MSETSLLIGDIGGTNCRFAIANADSSGFSQERMLRCSDFETVGDAISHYLGMVTAPPPAAICLAAAGPVLNQKVRLTNSPWVISASNLRNVFGIESVRLLNDFEAVAHSLPFLSDEQYLQIGAPAGKRLTADHWMVAVLGPGTGLGTAGLQKFAEHNIPILAEAGHVGFAPETRLQTQVLQVLRERFDRVSVERLLSGPGLENLYWALGRVRGEGCAELCAAEIFSASTDDGDRIASEAVDVFFEILGQVAGDLALALGAIDGIFIAGGVVQRYPERLIESRFRSRFENKGRYQQLMKQIPTQLITHGQPGLLGAAQCALKLVEPSK